MGTIQREMDLSDFDALLELIRSELELLVDCRYEIGNNVSHNNKKMDVLDAVEKLKRRVEMY
jgi:hypothetical protein